MLSARYFMSSTCICQRSSKFLSDSGARIWQSCHLVTTVSPRYNELVTMKHILSRNFKRENVFLILSRQQPVVAKYNKTAFEPLLRYLGAIYYYS